MNESMNSELQSQCDKLHAIESCCSSPTILTWRKQNCHIMFIWTSENVKIFPNWYYVRRIHFHSDTLEDISILYNFPIICVDRNSQNVRINKQFYVVLTLFQCKSVRSKLTQTICVWQQFNESPTCYQSMMTDVIVLCVLCVHHYVDRPNTYICLIWITIIVR